MDKFARSLDPAINQVMASISGVYEEVLVAATDGTLAADVRPLVRLSVTVIAEKGDRRERGSAGGGGRFGYDYFLELDGLESRAFGYVREAVRQALVNLDAIDAPVNTMPVVLGAGWPGVLLHEAVGHGLEGISTARAPLPLPSVSRWLQALHHRRRRHPAGSAWFRFHRRRGDAGRLQRADRERHPQGLPAGQAERPPDGRAAHRQQRRESTPPCRCRA